MIEAVLRVTLPCSWVVEVTERHGATVNIVEQKVSEGGELQTLAEIDPGEADPDEVVETLRRNAFVRDIEAIVPPRGKVLATLQVQDCHACQALSESECFLTDATATETGGLEWRIVSTKRSAVEELVATLKGRGIDIEVAAVRSVTRSGTLTDRQDRVLSLAFKLGYFEFPKRINLTDLAKKLDVSKSTLSEILRTGEEKILHSYFQGLMKRPR